MKIIGLLGGIASGKSWVAEQLVRLGGKVIDADRIGHDVLRQPQIEAAAKEHWGEAVLGPDGRIDRARLARLVFAPPPDGPRERTILEQLTHPEIVKLVERQAKKLAADGEKIAVLDAALLLEAGWARYCDLLVFVEAPADLRLQRALARGWKKEDFSAREAAQKSLDFKREQADVIIDNSGSLEQTQVPVERLWKTLLD
jgi:dephospho-CoA kinase